MMRKFSSEKCTEREYLRLFDASAEQFHWLCYTLTGDSELANQAYDAALTQSVKSAGQVFRAWMSSWVRRQVIKSCIAVVRPTLSRNDHPVCSCRATEIASADFSACEVLRNLPGDVLQQKLLLLDVLSRFVFVLRALEEHSRRETALLLNLDDGSCDSIYSQATKAMGASLADLTNARKREAVSQNAARESWWGDIADSTRYQPRVDSESSRTFDRAIQVQFEHPLGKPVVA